jgi:hypothetical protein
VDIILPQEQMNKVRDPESRESWTLPLFSQGQTRSRGVEPVDRIKTAAAACIPPFSEMALRVRRDRKGLSVIRPVQRKHRLAMLSNGLMELPKDVPWTVLVANFTPEPVMVTRGQVLGLVEEPRAVMFTQSDPMPETSVKNGPDLEGLQLDVSDELRP